MKHTQYLLPFFVMLVALHACNRSSEQEQVDADAAYVPSASSCNAPASWFTSVNGKRHTPAPNEGSTSVFAKNATVSNCDFHQWSWQKFLWLTNDINGRPLFLDSLYQITAEGTRIESNQVILRDIGQASSASDILITNSEFNSNQVKDTVYYSIHVSHSFYQAMLKYGHIYTKDSTKLKYTTFPVGALEVKISWVDAAALADTTTYFITSGNIKGRSKRIALLGMHVVGVVENHPEFVWATFEHHDLAPTYDWSKAKPDSDAPVTSAVDKLLFKKNDTATVKNISTRNGIYTNVFSVYQYGVPVEKKIKGSFDVLVYMETSQPGAENFGNIRAINEGVKSQLTDVWNNYFYNGSIWINTAGFATTKDQAKALDSLSFNIGASNPGDLTRGSVSVYNLTMETYVQVGFNPTSIHAQSVGKLVNCFSCHNPSNNSFNFNSPLLFSHVFSGYIGTLKGYTPHQVKQQHVDAIRAHFSGRKQAVN